MKVTSGYQKDKLEDTDKSHGLVKGVTVSQYFK